ncbi:MAG: SusD/RagB family nutrient-binding outer membrane lipoprotein [Chitinophagia bacterium]|nr:SusD/RagB family nutrient-binding outer membrane lipoprotein [Chitinophagia bacterium]
MKRSIYSLGTLAALALLLGGCKKQIDEAYTNPNATVRVPIETLLPGIISNFHGNSSAAGSAYGLANDGMNVGRYIQYWASNGAGNQYDQMGGATGASDVMGSIWAMHYYGMGQNLNRMIEWGIEEKKWDYVGVGYAIRAWSWLVTTEMYGEIIMREAFNTSQLVFKYDTQPDVYDTVRVIARQALDYLNRTGDGVSQANLAKGDAYFLKGDVNKWKKFVYATLALSFNHLSNKSNYSPDSVIKYASQAMLTNADNATMTFANTGITGTSNFYGPYRNNVGTMRQGAYIANLMTGANPVFAGVSDPRAFYLLRENPNNTIRGILPNKGTSGLATNDQPRNFWGGLFSTSTAPTVDTGSRYIFRNGAPFPVFTASMMKFILAEAYYRKGMRAEALANYTDGISLNIDQLLADFSYGIRTQWVITPAIKNAFLAVVPTAANLRLSHIMLQKYIALYGWGMQETWTDMRRYHYTDIEQGTTNQVYADFTPPSGIDLFIDNKGKLVYRARPRYNSEYLYNVAELQRLGALDLDYNTKEQWFSQK